jgi:hypothetical protein
MRDRPTKRIYRVQAAPQFQWLWLDIPAAQFRGIGDVPVGGAWRAPPAYVQNPLLPRADFVASKEFGLACPRSLVRAHPESGIERDCDLYPLRISGESEEYVIFRPRRVVSEDSMLSLESSMLFRTAADSNEVHAAVLEGSGQPFDNFLRFAQRFTGLELVAEA